MRWRDWTVRLAAASAAAPLAALRRRVLHAVVVYHRVVSNRLGPANGLPIIDAEELRRELQWLQKHGEVLSFDDWHKSWSEKPSQGGGLRTLVTFDDGYRDSLNDGLAVCREFGIRPLMFLATGYVEDASRHPWWDVLSKTDPPTRIVGSLALTPELVANPAVTDATIDLLRPLCAPGTRLPVRLGDNAFARWSDFRSAMPFADVGAHSVWHPRLAQLDADRLAFEVSSSTAAIIGRLGCFPRAFAYPFGKSRDISPQVVHAISRSGYAVAFTNLAAAASANSDPLLLPRLCGGAGTFWRQTAKLRVAELPWVGFGCMQPKMQLMR